MAEVAGDAAIAVEAGGVPVGVGGGDGEVAGVGPVGVRMPEVAVEGTAPAVVVPLALVVALALVPLALADVPM